MSPEKLQDEELAGVSKLLTAMPLNIIDDAIDPDLNFINVPGFYTCNNKAATHAPAPDLFWSLYVVSDESDVRNVNQTYQSNSGKWWRSTNRAPYNWGDWKPLVNEPAMPITTVTGVVDVNQLVETGLYVGVNAISISNPYHVGDGWFLEVWAQSNTIIQIFMDTRDRQSRSSNDGGITWSKWKIWQLDKNHMPAFGQNDIFSPDDEPDLDLLTANGFFMGVAPQRPAKNGPPGTSSPFWNLMATGSTINYAPNEGTTFLAQLYFDPNGVWYRTLTKFTWSNWVSLTSESSAPKAYGSAYRLGDAIIAKDHFIPFTSIGPNSGCQLDAQTGELIVGQAGDYSVSLSLHLNNNQPASFAIAIDGNIPEHYPVLHYEHATSTYAGIQSAQVTGLIHCEAGQRIAVKNVTGQSVTLRHAVNGMKCQHLLTLTQVG